MKLKYLILERQSFLQFPKLNLGLGRIDTLSKQMTKTDVKMPKKDSSVKQIIDKRFNHAGAGKVTNKTHKSVGGMFVHDPDAGDFSFANRDAMAHEGLHHVLQQIATQYGEDYRLALIKKLVSFIPGDVKKQMFIMLNDYEYDMDANFMEEMLTFAYDILTNKKARYSFVKSYSSDGNPTDERLIDAYEAKKDLLKAWNKIISYSKNLTPEKLENLI